jgi:hypothetical protein
MIIAFTLALVASVAGFVASYFWYRSATVQAAPTWAKGDGYDSLREPVIRSLAQDGWIAGTLMAMSEGAAWNRKAAIWSAIAVLLTGLASVASALGL